MNRTTVLISLIASALSGTAAAADPHLGRNLAATCANCHGTDGKSVGGMEALAGMPRDKIIISMKAFQRGEKSATIMHQLAKGYTDAQIDAIAGYLSAQKMEAAP